MKDEQLFLDFAKVYYPTPFIFCPLPLRQPKENTWVKTTPSAEMILTSHFGVPSGKWGRDCLSLLCTEAIKHQTRNITFGDSRSSAIRILGRDERQGSNHKRFMNTMLQLSTTMLTFEAYNNSTLNLKNVRIVEDGAFNKKEGVKGIKIHSANEYDYCGDINLSDEFFKAIHKRTVPLNGNIYKELGPLEADVYSWMVRRYYGLYQSDRITWASLYSQFSDVDLSNRKKQQKEVFRKRFKNIMLFIKANYYEQASFDFEKEGIRLVPSELAIKKQDEIRTIT